MCQIRPMAVVLVHFPQDTAVKNDTLTLGTTLDPWEIYSGCVGT